MQQSLISPQQPLVSPQQLVVSQLQFIENQQKSIAKPQQSIVKPQQPTSTESILASAENDQVVVDLVSSTNKKRAKSEFIEIDNDGKQEVIDLTE